jgi:hypothetical protein
MIKTLVETRIKKIDEREVLIVKNTFSLFGITYRITERCDGIIR